jgi:hypothetical protein
MPPLKPTVCDINREANGEDYKELVQRLKTFLHYHYPTDSEYDNENKNDLERIFEATWKAIRMDKKTTLSNLLDAYEDLTDWIRLDNQFLIYQAASSRPRLVLQTPRPEYQKISRKSREAVRAAKMQIQQHLSPNRYIANW